MDLRQALQELAERHQLSPAAARRLEELAEIDAEPPHLSHAVRFGMAIFAGALCGLGIIFWVAANWALLSRFGQFALLQSLVVLMCVGAAYKPAARAALSLLALLATGGLFAYFGQTYQTGSDPWQLFALWAALTLPLCLGARHDALWTPWSLVAMTAIALWIHAHTGRNFNADAADLPYHVTGWCAALLLVIALGPGLRTYTGAGTWPMRVATTLAACLISWTGLFALFDNDVAPQFALGLAVLVAAAGALSTARLHDTFALSALAFAINVLLVSGLARLLLDGSGSEPVFQMVLIGLAAAALLAFTVKAVIAIARRHATGAGT